MKFHITDEEGVTSVVEEIEENKDKTTDEDTTASLTSEEIAALKSLASIADKLKALVDNSVSDEDAENDPEAKDLDRDVEDEDEDFVEEKEEKVVDTDEESDKDDDDSIHDSVGSITRKKYKVASNDSITTQESIAAAWAKRYGGNK